MNPDHICAVGELMGIRRCADCKAPKCPIVDEIDKALERIEDLEDQVKSLSTEKENLLNEKEELEIELEGKE